MMKQVRKAKLEADVQLLRERHKLLSEGLDKDEVDKVLCLPTYNENILIALENIEMKLLDMVASSELYQ